MKPNKIQKSDDFCPSDSHESKVKEEIEKKFYKLKPDDKLTLTGKQLKEFAEFNINKATADLIKKERYDNCCEQEFLNYILGYFKSNTSSDSHIFLLVKERLDNTMKRYEELKQMLVEK
ncbi:MAG: hypothetical protein EHM47_00800 [Ignavibacteriales bacterium]|nr:MAG: hypothetical protein EHM47_00800 [Ignavibacteriales bacterium]